VAHHLNHLANQHKFNGGMVSPKSSPSNQLFRIKFNSLRAGASLISIGSHPFPCVLMESPRFSVSYRAFFYRFRSVPVCSWAHDGHMKSPDYSPSVPPISMLTAALTPTLRATLCGRGTAL